MSAPARLPRVIVSSVIRSSHQGEAHGGLYIVDMEDSSVEQTLDWRDQSISWYGRGAERGLRGIAVHGDRLYLASSDELLVYDPDFRLEASFKNRHLKHCHEICAAGDSLFMASTGFDSALEFDLRSKTFVRGYCLRYGNVPAPRRPRKLDSLERHLRLRPGLLIFDPQSVDGPAPGDRHHLNNVFWEDGTLYVAGTGWADLFAIRGNRVRVHQSIPFGSHNARPFRGGVLLNDTSADRISYLGGSGRVEMSIEIQGVDEDRLVNSGLSGDIARQRFGRGLVPLGDNHVVGGSSPATVSLYQIDPPRLVKSVNLTMDVRNAVHGLAIWPF